MERKKVFRVILLSIMVSYTVCKGKIRVYSNYLENVKGFNRCRKWKLAFWLLLSDTFGVSNCDLVFPCFGIFEFRICQMDLVEFFYITYNKQKDVKETKY